MVDSLFPNKLSQQKQHEFFNAVVPYLDAYIEREQKNPSTKQLVYANFGTVLKRLHTMRVTEQELTHSGGFFALRSPLWRETESGVTVRKHDRAFHIEFSTIHSRDTHSDVLENHLVAYATEVVIGNAYANQVVLDSVCISAKKGFVYLQEVRNHEELLHAKKQHNLFLDDRLYD